MVAFGSRITQYKFCPNKEVSLWPVPNVAFSVWMIITIHPRCSSCYSRKRIMT